MGFRTYLFSIIFVLLFLSACSTGLHGSFAERTFIDTQAPADVQELGPVLAESCQPGALYIFPIGSQPSTAEAIRLAKEQINNTAFLTDVSIDDKVY